MSWPADRRRLDDLAQPIAMVAAGPATAHRRSTTGGTTVRHSSSASGQRSTKTQVGRSVPICGRLPGIVDSGRCDLADAVARQRAQQAQRVRVLGMLEDGRGVALLDDLAGVHHADPVAQRPDDAEVVGDEQDRGVGLGLERADEVEDARLDRRVEPGRRLVEDQQLRVRGERDGDDDALLHPARQLVRIALGDLLRVGDLDPVEGLERVRLGLLLALAEDGERLDDLRADLGRRVERRARVLVDHRGVVRSGTAGPARRSSS